MDASDAQTFSPSGFSFSNPTFWNIVLAVALLVFGLLLIDVKAEGLFYTWDHQIAARFSAIESSLSASQDAFVRVVGKLGSNGTAVLAILLAVIWLILRAWHKLALIVASVLGGELLWLLLLFAIDRPRPQTVVSAVGVELPSFPSGHALIVVALYGILLYIFWPLFSPLGRRSAVALAAGWILLTGFIRLLVGAHYLTDVLAGYAIGVAWVILAVRLVERFFDHRPYADAA